jgi:hypothetical protein
MMQLGYEEPIARNAAGMFYKQKVMGFYPGDDAFSRINLGNMPYSEYVLIGKMRAGGFFLMLGTEERGLQFDADYASGNGGISTAGAKFAFSLNALEKGYVLLSFSEAPATAPPGYEVPDGGRRRQWHRRQRCRNYHIQHRRGSNHPVDR